MLYSKLVTYYHGEKYLRELKSCYGCQTNLMFPELRTNDNVEKQAESLL